MNMENNIHSERPCISSKTAKKYPHCYGVTIIIMLSLQGFAPIWGFSIIIYKTFAKDFSQVSANLPP